MAFAERLDEPAGPLPVKVIRSERRKKTSEARIVNGVIEVRIPSWMNEAEEHEAVTGLTARVERKRAIDETPIDLEARAAALSAKYGLPPAVSIRWATNQNTLWGSCAYVRGDIRISARLAKVPAWVLDYVILHELTHLIEPSHNANFHQLMDRYPKGERAEGFLDAMALGFSDH